MPQKLQNEKDYKPKKVKKNKTLKEIKTKVDQMEVSTKIEFDENDSDNDDLLQDILDMKEGLEFTKDMWESINAGMGLPPPDEEDIKKKIKLESIQDEEELIKKK